MPSQTINFPHTDKDFAKFPHFLAPSSPTQDSWAEPHIFPSDPPPTIRRLRPLGGFVMPTEYEILNDAFRRDPIKINIGIFQRDTLSCTLFLLVFKKIMELSQQSFMAHL